MQYLTKLRFDVRCRALVTGDAGGIGSACLDPMLEAGA
jgi:NAD(P)-dependent dehydrogenase (short-subunit alcohol dehydrogenase family)